MSAHAATGHLIELRNERILFLMRPGRRTIGRRCEGWCDGLIAKGLSPSDNLLVTVKDWLLELAIQALTQRITERGLDFTAVLAAGDSLVVGVLGIQQEAFSVPGDFSVMGMDDLPQAGDPQSAADDHAHPDARDQLSCS